VGAGASAAVGASPAYSGPHASVFREASFRKSLKSLKKVASSRELADSGFSTFTSGLRAGWQREAVTKKFWQVGRTMAAGHEEDCSAISAPPAVLPC
jgi:hypothetical protein